ncbi:MAG: cobyric acid synthase [Alphaproteobacteria bacterium]|jgi:adenosylcobyric acid synthase
MTAAIMFQGTGSDVGKSMIVAGLARLFARQGLVVRPFKPQNMSNNAAPAIGLGNTYGEIGRAQALQARAAGLDPTTDMNPVLLKPQSDIGAQVVVDGRVIGNADARAYHAMKPDLLESVLAAYRRLSEDADLILVEGAGSPAEINLREGDIANMGFAEAADLPVALIGDIERGGVIAALVGTWTLLTPSEQARLKGYIINRFRGDVSLFDDALPLLASRTGLNSLGIIPWFEGARTLPAEDTASLEHRYTMGDWAGARIRVAVPQLPRIANFDDLDPLAAEPDVALRLVAPGERLPADANLILLAGSKSTRGDLDALRQQNWDEDIHAAVQRGAKVFGICGGYQMLGRAIADPDGIEGTPGTTAGLGLLDIETIISSEKTLAPVSGTTITGGAEFSGFEMHMGHTSGPDTARSLLQLGDGRTDGARSPNRKIAGSYIHGLFAADPFRHQFLAEIDDRHPATFGWNDHLNLALDGLADHMQANLDTAEILRIARNHRNISRSA